MNWIKKITIRLLLILFGFIIALLIAEGILRISGKKPLGYQLPKWYYIKTDYGYDLNKNFWPPENFYIEGITYPIWTNELGCFDNSPKPDSKILLVGDSFTWAYAPLESKWGAVLEKNIKIGTLKCGVPGYGTKQSFLKAKNIISFHHPKPQLIIYSYHFNDLIDDFLYPGATVIGGYLVDKTEINDINTGAKITFSEEILRERFENYLKYKRVNTPRYPFIQRTKTLLRQNFILFNLVEDYIKGKLITIFDENFLRKIQIVKVHTAPSYLFFVLEKYPWAQSALNEHFGNLKEFKNLPTDILITLIPIKEQVYPELLNCKQSRIVLDTDIISSIKTDEDLVKPQKIIREFLEKEKIPYIDYLPLLRFYADHRKKCFLDNKKDLYWSVDGHLNIKGNHLVGLLLARFLVKEGLIEVQNKDEILAEIENNLKTEFGKLPPDDLWQSAIYIPKK